MNSVSTRPVPCGNPQSPPPLSTHHRSIRLLKPQDSLLLNCFSKQTLTVSSSFPFNTTTFGKCTSKLKLHSGPPRRSTSRPTPQPRTALLTANATSSHPSWPSLWHQTALSTRTFKSQSRTSIVKPTHFSLIHTSKTPRQKITSYGRSKRYRASNKKRSGPLNGATPHPLAPPNA